MDNYTQRLNEFCYAGNKHFVDPERVAAVEILGLEKAEELYKKYNNNLPWNIRCDLGLYSVCTYLLGE